MHVKHKLVPLVLVPTMFALGANPAQADEFSFDRAEWSSSSNLLTYRGHGEEGSIVEAYISHTLVSLGRATVDNQGRWAFRFTNPDSVPCRVRIETGPYSGERDVSNAPPGCINEDNLNDINSQPVNNPPVISGAPGLQVETGQTYSFRPSATDADGDNLTFSITNQPSWANFNTSTGVLSGTPGTNAVGAHSNIVIAVSDGNEQSSLAPFTIRVSEAATEGGTFRFARSTYSVDEGDTVTLTVIRNNSSGRANLNVGTRGISARSRQDYNGFNWRTINFQNGETRKTVRVSTLSDTITEGNETFRVQLSAVSDGYSLTSPSASLVTIHDAADSNNTPVISGTPSQQVTAGEAYTFTPAASDADNDNLIFSVANLPNWARFNTANGALSGIPTDNDTGQYSNIIITVSDGTDTASLRPFNLTVEASIQVATGDISLSWVAPSTRFDGTALSLSEIAGYKIYMGTSANRLEPVLDLEDGSLDRYVMEDVENGTYYFAITAYDTAGSESDFSNIVTKESM
jgi:hypothetical protein